MGTIRAFIATLTMILTANMAQAVELAYQWSPGQRHHYAYSEDSRFQMTGLPQFNFKVESQFTQKVQSVDFDGTADVVFELDTLKIYESGRLVQTLSDLPARARQAKAKITKAGKATFYQTVKVIRLRPGVFRLQISITNQGVYLYAHAGHRWEEHQVNQADSTIDTVPEALAQFLELPTTGASGRGGMDFGGGFGGDFGGDFGDMFGGQTQISATMDSYQNGIARLTGEGSLNFGMGDMGTKLTAVIKYIFDNNAGQILEVRSEKFNSTTEMMGFRMVVDSDMKLVRHN